MQAATATKLPQKGNWLKSGRGNTGTRLRRNPTEQQRALTLIELQLAKGQVEQAEECLKAFLRSGFKLDQWAFNSVLLGWAEQGKHYRVRNLYQTLLRSSLAPNADTYAALLIQCVQSRYWKGIPGILQNAKAKVSMHVGMVACSLCMYTYRKMYGYMPKADSNITSSTFLGIQPASRAGIIFLRWYRYRVADIVWYCSSSCSTDGMNVYGKPNAQCKLGTFKTSVCVQQ
jgi:hypothetical protein